MTTTGLNHVSISVGDLDHATDFYARLLGATPVPSPYYGEPERVRWLRVGSHQLHVLLDSSEPLWRQHFAVSVDDIEPVFREAERCDAFDREAFRGHLFLLPGDCVQLFVRDPFGNLVEIDALGWERLPADIRAQARELPFEQSGEHRGATLFLT